MPTKRITPSIDEGAPNEFVFLDGARQLPAWEQAYLGDAMVVELTGKHLNELTYQQWQEEVFSAMQIRNHLVREVSRQRVIHFAR